MVLKANTYFLVLFFSTFGFYILLHEIMNLIYGFFTHVYQPFKSLWCHKWFHILQFTSLCFSHDGLKKMQVPRVFIGEECVGGGSDVQALHKSGKLKEMLESIGALQWSDLQVYYIVLILSCVLPLPSHTQGSYKVLFLSKCNTFPNCEFSIHFVAFKKKKGVILIYLTFRADNSSV